MKPGTLVQVTPENGAIVFLDVHESRNFNVPCGSLGVIVKSYKTQKRLYINSFHYTIFPTGTGWISGYWIQEIDVETR